MIMNIFSRLYHRKDLIGLRKTVLPYLSDNQIYGVKDYRGGSSGTYVKLDGIHYYYMDNPSLLMPLIEIDVIGRPLDSPFSTPIGIDREVKEYIDRLFRYEYDVIGENIDDWHLRES
jgi:hypothetical protein